MTAQKIFGLIARTSTYGRLIALQYFFSLSLISVIVIAYHYDLRVIWLHFLYLTEVLVVQTLLVLSAARWLASRSTRLTAVAITGIVTLTSVFLLLLYAANILSNAIWGSYVNNTLLRDASAHISALLVIADVHPVVFYIGMMIAYAMFFGTLYRTGLSVAHEFHATNRRAFLLGPSKSHAQRSLIVGIAFSFYVGSYSVFALGHWTPSMYQGEPISSLFLSDEIQFKNRLYHSTVAKNDITLRRAYRAPSDFERRNVVLISVDSLRASSLPMYGSTQDAPFLQKLHRGSAMHVIPDAVSICPESVCGIMSTLSSRHYSDVTTGLFKLNDLLIDVGYKVVFILSGSHTWNGLRQLYGDSFHYYVDGTSFTGFTLNDDRGVVDQLETQADFSGQPTFFFIHLMTTHMLGRATRIPRPPNTSFVVFSVARDQDRYNHSIALVDEVISKIFTVLQKKGYLQNSVVVIVGDHGEAFGEHGAYGHLNMIYEEALRIPLLIYDSTSPPLYPSRYATQLDVAPTIVHRLGLPIPSSWQGRSLLQPAPHTRVTIHQTVSRTPTFAVRYSVDKLIYKLITNKFMPTEFDHSDELYELNNDPRELENIIARASPQLLSFLRQQLIDYQRKLGSAGVAATM